MKRLFDGMVTKCPPRAAKGSRLRARPSPIICQGSTNDRLLGQRALLQEYNQYGSRSVAKPKELKKRIIIRRKAHV